MTCNYKSSATLAIQFVFICPTCSHADYTDEEPDSNLPNPSSQSTGPIYAEITDGESKEPTYASVEVATGKYTYNITTNSSYDTVMLQNMNPNLCYGNI